MHVYICMHPNSSVRNKCECNYHGKQLGCWWRRLPSPVRDQLRRGHGTRLHRCALPPVPRPRGRRQDDPDRQPKRPGRRPSHINRRGLVVRRGVAGVRRLAGVRAGARGHEERGVRGAEEAEEDHGARRVVGAAWPRRGCMEGRRCPGGGAASRACRVRPEQRRGSPERSRASDVGEDERARVGDGCARPPERGLAAGDLWV
ncbi:hypothetical protein ACQJBY_014794 [Aegilops geniculata]